MNNILSLLGLGAVALYFNQQTKDEAESLSKKLKDALDKLHDMEVDREVEEIEEELNEASAKNFGVALKMKLAQSTIFGVNNYNFLREITIQNNTTKNVFTIKKVAAVLTLDGHTDVYNAFGQKKTVTLRPGEKATFQTAVKNARLFEFTSDAVEFNDTYLNTGDLATDARFMRKGECIEDKSGLLFANYICAEINNGVETTTITWNTVPGTLEIYATNLSNWGEIGDNAFSNGEYEKLIQ